MTITKAIGFANPPSNTGSNNFSPLESESFKVESLPFTQLSTQKPKPKFTSCLDWVQGMLTLTQSQFEFLLGELSNIFKDTFGENRGAFREGKQFQCHRVSDRQGKIFWNLADVDGDRQYDVLIWLPAKFLRGCSDLYLLRRFIWYLCELGFRPTRLDAAIDDFTKSLTWSQIDEAYKAGNAHGFKNIDPRFPMHRGIYGGFSYPMGSPSSDKISVLYDKSIESRGEIDAHRLESRFKDGWAKGAWQLITQAAHASQTDESFHKTLVNLTCSAIDFYEVIDKEKVELTWWADWKKMVKAEGISINCGRTKSSIESTMNWHKQGGVSRTLATVEQFCSRTGADFAEYINDLLEYGRTKIRSVHLNQVDAAMKQLEKITDNMMGFYYEKFGEYPIGMEL